MSEPDIDDILKEAMKEAEEVEEKRPFVIELSRDQTPNEIKTLIKTARDKFDKDKISSIRIPIKGYETEGKHPALIINAKKKYMKACEAGLIGFLVDKGYDKEAEQLYLTAYCRARIGKNGEGEYVIRFNKYDRLDFLKKRELSIRAYEKLV